MSAYVGQSNKARAVKAVYVGVGTYARKVLSAYVGVDNKARKWWSSKPAISYVNSLPISTHRAVGASTTNHALVLSGVTWNGSAHVYTNLVTAYDKLLVQSFPSPLPTAVQMFAGCSAANGTAVFAGGNDSSNVSVNAGYSYNSALTRSNITISPARRSLAAAPNGSYVLFAGGRTSPTGGYSTVVDAFNASLTRTVPTALSVARDGLIGAGVTGYALFAGGFASSTHSAVVDAYNSSNSRSLPTALSVARQDLTSASLGTYALFAGGYSGSNSVKSTVDAYDVSRVRSVKDDIFTAGTMPSGAAIAGKYAIIAGGNTMASTNVFANMATAYDTSLTRTRADNLSVARSHMAATSIGDYMIFAGGANKTGNAGTVDTVDIYDKDLFHFSSERSGLQNTYTVTTTNFTLTPGSYTLYITGKGGAAGTTGTSAGQYNSSATYIESSEDWSCNRTYKECTGGLGGTGGNAQSNLIDITVATTTMGSFTVATGNASVTILGNTYTVNNGVTGGNGVAGKITKNAYVDVQCYYDSCTSTPGTDAPFVALTPPHSSLSQYGRGADAGKAPGGAVLAIFKNT